MHRGVRCIVYATHNAGMQLSHAQRSIKPSRATFCLRDCGLTLLKQIVLDAGKENMFLLLSTMLFLTKTVMFDWVRFYFWFWKCLLAKFQFSRSASLVEMRKVRIETFVYVKVNRIAAYIKCLLTLQIDWKRQVFANNCIVSCNRMF